MKRWSVVLAGALMLAGLVSAAAPAGASLSRPTVTPSATAGTYTFHIDWDNGGYEVATVVINRDHTATDDFGDSITWSRSGRSFEMIVDNASDTYLGTKSKKGFSSPHHPGTMSSNAGDSGIWYAIKAP